MNDKIQVTKAEFTRLVNEGKSNNELAEYFNLSKNQVKDIAKTLNLTITRQKRAGWVLVDTNEESILVDTTKVDTDQLKVTILN